MQVAYCEKAVVHSGYDCARFWTCTGGMAAWKPSEGLPRGRWPESRWRCAVPRAERADRPALGERRGYTRLAAAQGALRSLRSAQGRATRIGGPTGAGHAAGLVER